MKIIDLLNKIANNEEVPEKIFYANQYWINKYPNDYEGLGYGGCLLNNVCLNNLNDEVEIIEEEKKIPEKLNIELNSGDKKKVNCYRATNLECYLAFKINEILDYLQSKGE